jgi:hypothetical protein
MLATKVICFLIASFYITVQGFTTGFSTKVRSSSLNALDDSALKTLDGMKAKYDRLSAVDSPEADAERSQMQEVVEKYSTYKEVKLMMIKLRSMWRSEASERRRAKQLKSFMDLYKGRVEIEEILKEKIGLPSSKDVTKVEALDEVLKIDAEIEALQQKLKQVEMIIPTGMSTREERFTLP